MKEAAGILLYRRNSDGLSVLLVHPSGNYNAKAPWSIPKGLPEPEETLEQTARRETKEETGVEVTKLIPHGFIDYVKSKKRIHCWISQATEDCQPKCNSWEVDRAEFLPITEAKKKIHPDQLPFLLSLERSQ